MRCVVLLLLAMIVLSACGSNGEEETEGAENLFFGEPTEGGDLEARNAFEVGEEVYFAFHKEGGFETDEVLVELSIINEETNEYEAITDASLPVPEESEQYMNGFPGETFEEIGAGPYLMEIYAGEERFAYGEFIME
ncbi:hypothetical protein [Salsuginibacillus kocurii]|uniref:hypothetical protein n=1 Tax=Salsuginibacillus kocurii TaxID=427078 RepID=UPI000377B7F5|nr:hypothetical protein [Salsuginibacillus kocurii]